MQDAHKSHQMAKMSLGILYFHLCVWLI